MVDPEPITPSVSSTHHADVIRDMIRHEENMIVSRAHWLVTLQGVLFAGVAFSWQNDVALNVTLMLFGLASAIMFIPHLKYANVAIASLQLWMTEHEREYLGPPLRGISEDRLDALTRYLLNWKALPTAFLAAWIVLGLIWILGRVTGVT